MDVRRQQKLAMVEARNKAEIRFIEARERFRTNKRLANVKSGGFFGKLSRGMGSAIQGIGGVTGRSSTTPTTRRIRVKVNGKKKKYRYVTRTIKPRNPSNMGNTMGFRPINPFQ